MKKNYCHFLALFILMISMMRAYAQQDTIFYDSFNNNDKNWTLADEKAGYAKIEDGKYKLLIGTLTPWLISPNKMYLKSDSDFSLEAEFESVNDGEYGFFWGAKDATRGYCFTINKTKFRTFKCIDGKFIPLAKYTSCNFIDPITNTLKIVREKDNIFYYINSQQVHQEKLKKLLGRNFGFIIWNPHLDKTAINVDYILMKGEGIPFNPIPEVVYDSKPENLGSKVNSVYSEIAPIISPDNKTLFLIRNHPENIGGFSDQDIYFSIKSNNEWSEATTIGKQLNNSWPNGVWSVTPDGNTLLVMHKYDQNGNSYENGLSFSQRTMYGWSNPTTIKIMNYYNSAKFNEFYMSNDAKTILLTIERDDTFGGRDIYVSFLQESGEWSEPMNIGPVVNSEDDEMSPFMASDGVTLYFSTDGLPGYGSNDIFVTKRLDDTWKNWSVPQNIGPPVNTSGWDAYYSIPASGEYAYFVSSDNSIGLSDIFRIKLPKNAQPDPVVLIYGKVINLKTKQPVESTITYEILPQGTESGIAHSNPANGEYKIVLPYGKNYGFSANIKGFFPVSDNIDLSKIAEYREIKRDLFLVPIEEGSVIRLNNIFFDFNKSELRLESYPELNKLMSTLNQYSSMELEMAGHTDNVGSDEYNNKLSRGRAGAVRDYLLSKGIMANRIIAKGYGKSKPVATNDTEEGRQLNRRVEFTITKK